MAIVTGGLTPDGSGISLNGRLSFSGPTVSDGHMKTDSGVLRASRSFLNTSASVRWVGFSRLYRFCCSTYGKSSTAQPQYPVFGVAFPAASRVTFHPAG